MSGLTIQSGICHSFKVLGDVPNYNLFDIINIYMINLKADPIDGADDPMIVQLRHLLNKEYDKLKEFLNKNNLKFWDKVEEVIEMYTTIKEMGIKEGEKKERRKIAQEINQELKELNKNTNDTEFRKQISEYLEKFIKPNLDN